MVIKFKRSWGPYNEGEVAGFALDVEQDLVSRGIAEFFNAGAPASPSPSGTEEGAARGEPVPRSKGVMRVPPSGVARGKPLGRGRSNG